MLIPSSPLGPEPVPLCLIKENKDLILNIFVLEVNLYFQPSIIKSFTTFNTNVPFKKKKYYD